MKAKGNMKNRNQRLCLIFLLAVCMGIITAGGLRYMSTLQTNLTNQAIANVMTVTQQQQQALDNFISGDRERIHSYAEYFSKHNSGELEEMEKWIKAFTEMDAIFTLFDLNTGHFCNSRDEGIFLLDEERWENYRTFTGSGVREPYISIYSDATRFGYYECFTFADGVPGLIQKSYDRSKVSSTFSLSFYNNQGLAYVVNREGKILLHSDGMMGDHIYDNILDMLVNKHGEQPEAERLLEALAGEEAGSKVFQGSSGNLVYTYVPLEEVDGWSLVSVVPMSAITKEAGQLLRQSQMVLLGLSLILVVCGGFILLIWHTHMDIAQKDRELRYQEELFNIFAAHLSQNTNDVYMLIDPEEERVKYISPNAERVLGVPPEQIGANFSFKSLRENKYGSGGEIEAETLLEMKPGDSLNAVESQWINPKTAERRFFYTNVYCTLVQGERKLVIYISDRTRERRTEESLTEALNLAKAANEAKSSFLSSVSHDIRTPMNAIIGLVALLQGEAGHPDVVLEYAKRIDAASQHLLGLINDVLDMNKIESGNTVLNLSEMSLAEVIDEINTIIRPQAKVKNQNFEIFASPLSYEYLQGDKLRINQILINLLSNAVKYTQEGGTIEMRVEELPRVVDSYSRIRFTVKDNGMGMSEEYQKVIFDPFTREETEATRQIQGTGLGMAITKSLVDLMGGSINVESKLGEGSTFTVELELYIQDREDDPRFWQEHHVSRMIVADDEEEVCRNIVKIMSRTGVIVDYSTDGETAVQMMREAREAGRPYDLILLDWKMPGLNGLETARLIRKNYPEKIPILLLTAYEWGDIEQEAREIGVNHFMPKPFFMSSFKDAIRRVMGNLRKAEAEKGGLLEGKHILVVDDIEVNRIILVKILQTMGAVCETAGNGQEALDNFESAPPGTYDVILMDVQMPVMDGYAATRAIRASSHPAAKTVPIIAMTANAFVDDVRAAIESGMDAHIAKPVQVDKLKATIQQVLERREEETEKNEEGSDPL